MRKIQQYVKESIQELKKVTWPTWEELKGSTLVVMIFSVIMGLYIAGLDVVFSMIVDKIMGRG
ncbi:preprotein translocase subunit SecE [uncultured Fibrobacter sp.]|jgi:preprotein translocase subunit SecE|uniref:preprotein translocase subunit SecE n=1 Tax=uncultured Fibrobacter sp. TaxID=261512 RepID=UPI0015680489|nr:preprotein translocase subunit SecE [uncultured Fibrobacter sp.]